MAETKTGTTGSKCTLCAGTSTHIVTSVELSRARSHDSPYYKPLVDATAKSGFNMQEISADKAYISADNLCTTVNHGATPLHTVQVEREHQAGRRSLEKALPLLQFQARRISRALSQASNVETTFSMIKAKFGERLRSKTETAQINEALCKVLCHNLCVVIQSMYELGVDPTFGVEAA